MCQSGPTSRPGTSSIGWCVNFYYHNVVVACLPAGVYGTISASTVVSHTVSTFPNIRFGLMVGIGGGVPHSVDIRVGDIVVSKPPATLSGVIQYDYGKTLRDGKLQHAGSLNKPPPVLLKAISQMESDYKTGKRVVNKTILDALQKNKEMKEEFSRPKYDWLFHQTYDHARKEPNCSTCDPDYLIASGDQVMKDAKTRDSLAQEFDILCFEMEAAGLMDELPSLVVRGICDYCDSYKQKQWQGHAVVAATAYAKALLSVVPINHDRNNPSDPREMLWMVPFRKNPRFIGRVLEIKEIEELIMQPHVPSKIAVCGLGGVGRTQIALELAYRMRDKYSVY
ncbi:uncharacterized protein ATNIH1004_007177 [Aspergillus tanneri]|uniref:Nucleoside phosphorylase domain-containing protein n=1 Tax=Aspergillus tanneri TaxID=1220188 RepID=A0A5M9MFK9_9EURO|nr:uncharacterized protein ATNIH1004_007177 [Aspergillus tanneri]KAA8645758.1 hypothetical protein ATNIH1004_007177 [Aspergillus tanneri]